MIKLTILSTEVRRGRSAQSRLHVDGTTPFRQTEMFGNFKGAQLRIPATKSPKTKGD